jgi:hypothetical protein
MVIKGDKVGIGTTTPDAILSVDSNVGGSSTGTIARFHSSKGEADSTFLQIAATRHGTASVQRVQLQAFDDDGSTGRTLSLNAVGGNVGIGTHTPAYKLDVAGSFHAKVGSSGILFNEYANGATIFLDGSNGDFSGADYFNISAYGTTDLAFGYGTVTKMTLKNSGNLNITDGNLVVASGHGIDFSATSNGTGGMTQEILDDYEEGTWTPTIVSYSGTNPTVTGTLGGHYTKIGRKVHIAWYGSTLNVSGTTGNILKFMGLPFPISDPSSVGSWTTHYVNLARPDFGGLTNIADGIGVLTSMDGVNQAWAWENVNIIGTNVSFRASMTYITNS